MRITEVSSVDRGAGHGVHVVLVKRDMAGLLYTSLAKDDLPDEVVAYLKREFSSDERDARAANGHAMSDGSFPIDNKSDLSNAIRAVGRAKNPDKAKAHIKTRARALGASDMLPDSWEKRDTTEETVMNPEQIAKLVNDSVTAAVAKMFESAGIALVKMTPEHAAYHGHLDGDEAKRFGAMSHDDRAKYVTQHPIKVTSHSKDGAGDNEDGETAAEEEGEHETEKALAKLLSDIRKAKKKKAAPTGDNRESPDGDDEKGSVEHRKRLDDVSKQNEDLKKRLGALEEEKAQLEFAKRAVSIGLTEKDGPNLLKVHRGDPEALKWLEGEMAKLRKQADAGSLFDTFGHNHQSQGTAHDEMVAKATELRKQDPKLTVEQAYVKAMEMNPDIAKREQAERFARINKTAA